MVTTSTAVKVTIPTIKIMMSMPSPQILTKKMSLIQMTKTRLLQQQPQGDGMNVWYLHIVKIEPKTAAAFVIGIPGIWFHQTNSVSLLLKIN